MAGQIRITPDVMRQRAGQYRNEAANVNAVIASMDNLLGMLQSEWEARRAGPTPSATPSSSPASRRPRSSSRR